MHLVTQSQLPYLPLETTRLAGLALPRQGEGLVLSLVMAVVSLQRRLSPGISTVKEIITLKKKRLFTILILMLAGALEPPALESSSSAGTQMENLSLSGAAGAACRRPALPAEVQQMRDAMSATTQLSDWALKSAGAAIDLQRSSSRCTRFSSVFWFLCDPPELGTFVQEVQQMRDAMSATTQLSDWALKSAGAAIDLQRSSSRCTGFSSVFWFLCDPPELGTFVQEVQQMRDAMSATTQLSDWALKSAGAAIDLQRSSSRCTGFSSVFWFLCDPPELGTFVQGRGWQRRCAQPALTFYTPGVTLPFATVLLQNGNPRAFQLLKLGIRSNWGKRGYTCIYRVQVHGKIVGASAVHQTHVDPLPE
ncbi:hypothetical protein Q9233_005926 [Columba guinea]|nr:hypothetical protein Q9233_005926 [Columba guinea]